MTESLARIRFVLVETTHTGNIGAVARAMKTMGLSRMELVAPKHRPDAEAMARASGADDLLQRAAVHEDLAGALTGCRLVIGASARRQRSVEWPLLEPSECARRLLDEASLGEVALVLGRESSGLTNLELGHCQYLVHIPTAADFSSLNLAAAAQVLAYEVRRQAREREGERIEETPRDLATADELEGLFGHLSETLRDIGFGDPDQSHKLMMRLRRLFSRARPDRVELNILRGMLSAAQGRKTPRQLDSPSPDSAEASTQENEPRGDPCSPD